MKIGVVGTGNMGKILIDALIEGKSVAANQFTIINRTKEKALMIQDIHKEIIVADDPTEIFKQSDLIFICIKPLDIAPLLKKYGELLTPEKCLISITSPLSVDQLYELAPCNIARIIPSITNRALGGITLVTYHKACSLEWKEVINSIFSLISKPVEITQDITRISSDITSCGPAFFSFILQKYISAATTETGISEEQATILATEMIIGMGQLLSKGIFTLPTLQEKVCVKGGITGEGIAVLEEKMIGVFEEVIHRTHKKFNTEVHHIQEQIKSL